MKSRRIEISKRREKKEKEGKRESYFSLFIFLFFSDRIIKEVTLKEKKKKIPINLNGKIKIKEK